METAFGEVRDASDGNLPMIALLADPTFLSLRWDAWAAIGIWVTVGVYVAIAEFARRQVGEARDLRREQTRPFVIVDVEFRSFLIMLSIKNIGRTAASNVKAAFDEKLTSSIPGADWEDSTAFTDGIPLMAPDREIRFLLDSFIDRENGGHAMVIRGTVGYNGPAGHNRQRYNEPFVIDLSNYQGSQLPENGIHELVGEVKELRKVLAK